MKRRGFFAALAGVFAGAACGRAAAREPLADPVGGPHTVSPDSYAKALEGIERRFAEHNERMARIAKRDTRDAPLVGRMKPGDTVVHSTGPGSVVRFSAKGSVIEIDETGAIHITDRNGTVLSIDDGITWRRQRSA